MKHILLLLLSLISSASYANGLTPKQIQTCHELKEDAKEIQQTLPIRSETTTFITSYEVVLKSNRCVISTVKTVDTVRIIELTRSTIEDAMRNRHVKLSNEQVYELLNRDVYYKTYKELLKERGTKIKENFTLQKKNYSHIIMHEKVLFHDKHVKDLNYTIKLKNI